MRTDRALPAIGIPPGAGGFVRRLRNITGLVLAVYVASHFVDHALGVISIDAQQALLDVLLPVWRSVPGTLALYGALLTHLALGLYALWRRKTLRMPVWEFAQLALGLLVPLLLIPHVFGTRIASEMLGTTPTYRSVVAAILGNPLSAIRQPVLVLIVWTHLIIGLHFWLRLRAGYRRALPVLYPLAVTVPLLALLGLYGAGAELRAAAEDLTSSSVYGAPPDAAAIPSAATDAVVRARLAEREDFAYLIYGGLLGLVVGARAVRRIVLARGASYRIHHANGRVVTAPVGLSLLEALRNAGIPHASVCGGRARCTTCRVRVDSGSKGLPPVEAIEAAALSRIGATEDVRLACQLRPTKSLTITPLLPPHVSPADLDVRRTPGHERRIAVMFVDLRESSRLGEHRLPYDVFFILNRFFAELADALRETGGYYSTFNGDGLMALYGTETGLARGCRDALRGAVAIQARLARINAALVHDLPTPLVAGIGVHAGDAIVGTMGPPATPILSALGDTVNVAARLEAETKHHRCAIIVSAACATAAAVDMSRFAQHTVHVRGRIEPVTYYAIDAPADLAAVINSAEPLPATVDATPHAPARQKTHAA
ncbi:MAG TPA: adenylate/guanylate cyclase domain-containing protein [Casimicrobiaceae bacterium]|nr:adenylate/guanylate cyclase domain-containing protein [Casimicrobiaceae bacterium]